MGKLMANGEFRKKFDKEYRNLCQRHLTPREAVSNELKDKEFRRYYEEEDRRLAKGYKIAKLKQKPGMDKNCNRPRKKSMQTHPNI